MLKNTLFLNYEYDRIYHYHRIIKNSDDTHPHSERMWFPPLIANVDNLTKKL